MRFPKLRSVEEFVAWEKGEDEKFEFSDGVISPFLGGTMRHEILVANLITALHAVVGPGRVWSSGLKTLTRSSSRYPDVAVGFDPRDTVEQRFVRYPTLLLEVLSPSTHANDRGPKFDECRTIETLVGGLPPRGSRLDRFAAASPETCVSRASTPASPSTESTPAPIYSPYSQRPISAYCRTSSSAAGSSE